MPDSSRKNTWALSAPVKHSVCWKQKSEVKTNEIPLPDRTGTTGQAERFER